MARLNTSLHVPKVSRLPKNRIGFFIGSSNAPIEITAFFDLICPFSRKAIITLKALQEKHSNQLSIRLINNVQPWHPQSYLASYACTEAYYGENQNNDAFIEAMDKVYSVQDQLSDEKVFTMTSQEILNYLRNDVLGTNELKEYGDHVVREIKNHVLYSRTQGIHVTPSFSINGLIESSPGSSWLIDDWEKHLKDLMETNSVE